MDANFWHQMWEANEIGFHEKNVHPLLVRYFDELALADGSRIFLPLCGKSLDIGWLLESGYQVVGVELSELAVRDLFKNLGLKPQVSSIGDFLHFQANRIDIYVGDFFTFSAKQLGPVDALYDRAALVALPPDMRVRYTNHLQFITRSARQLLICVVYDQSLDKGPPFSITEREVKEHYATNYGLTLRETREVEGGLKGTLPAVETAWLLV